MSVRSIQFLKIRSVFLFRKTIVSISWSSNYLSLFARSVKAWTRDGDNLLNVNFNKMVMYNPDLWQTKLSHYELSSNKTMEKELRKNGINIVLTCLMSISKNTSSMVKPPVRWLIFKSVWNSSIVFQQNDGNNEEKLFPFAEPQSTLSCSIWPGHRVPRDVTTTWVKSSKSFEDKILLEKNYGKINFLNPQKNQSYKVRLFSLTKNVW